MAKRGNILLKLIDAVMLIVTLAAVASLLFAYISPYVNPNKSFIFAYFGLAGPVIYLVNVVLMLYWALRWKPVFFLSAVAVAAGIGQIGNFYHFSPPTEDTGEFEGNTLRILSFNMEGFMDIDQSLNTAVPTAEEVTEFLNETDADIMCLQEYQNSPLYPAARLDSMLAKWPYKATHYTVRYGERGVWGTAIYSKYPILASEEIVFDSTTNGALSADILLTTGDTIRVFCNHLQTTYVDKKNLEFLNYYNFAQETDKKGHIRIIGGRLRKGFRKRAWQADSLALLIAETPYPVIVCGDFNDTPASYSYRKVKGALGDTFKDKGSGYGYSYKRIRRLMRIDYVLRSEDFQTLTYESPEIPWSDHNPVISVLRLKEQESGD